MIFFTEIEKYLKIHFKTSKTSRIQSYAYKEKTKLEDPQFPDFKTY